jgi:hypothetical protein
VFERLLRKVRLQAESAPKRLYGAALNGGMLVDLAEVTALSNGYLERLSRTAVSNGYLERLSISRLSLSLFVCIELLDGGRVGGRVGWWVGGWLAGWLDG